MNRLGVRFCGSFMAVCAVLFATAAWSIPSASAATAMCGTSNANRFDGYSWFNADSSYEGASTFITNAAPHLCTSDPNGPNPGANSIGSNFTTAWVMIADSDGNSWSQVGVIAGPAGTTYNWAEVSVGATHTVTGHATERFDRFLGSVGADTKQAFYEQFLYSCAAPTNGPCEESKVGNVRVTDTNFNPFAAVFDKTSSSVTGWRPEYNEEKVRTGSDFMGTPDDHTNYRSMGVQSYSDDQFSLIPCGLSSTPVGNDRGTHDAGGSCSDADIWTETP